MEAHQNGPETPFLYATLELWSSVAAQVPAHMKHAPDEHLLLCHTLAQARGGGPNTAARAWETDVLTGGVTLQSKFRRASLGLTVTDDVDGNEPLLDGPPSTIELHSKNLSQLGFLLEQQYQLRAGTSHGEVQCLE